MTLGNPVRAVSVTLAVLLVTGLATACSSAPKPQTTGSAYFAAWAKQDWAAMQQLVSQPPADFTAVNKAAFTSLGVHQGTFTIKSTLNLVQNQGHWLVTWSPATIAPQLRAGDQLSVKKTWPARAPILGAGGTPLTSQGDVVTIGVEGSRIKDAKAVQAALVAAGATAAQASNAIAAATQHPTYFEPVFTVSRDRYNQLEPTIYPIPGTVFEHGSARSALTPRSEE